MVKKCVFLAVVIVMILSLSGCAGLSLGGKTYVMGGQSMEPTLRDGDRVTASPVNRELQRGDIVVFSDPLPDANPHILFIKRVIGLPGETIEVKDGQVYINGTVFVEPYVVEKARYSLETVSIPEDHYFVLGDNRNSSMDSHVYGSIPENVVQGIVNR